MHSHFRLHARASEDTLPISSIIVVHVALIIIIVFILQCKHEAQGMSYVTEAPSVKLRGDVTSCIALSAWCA